MAEVSLVLAQLLVFLLIVSKTSASAPADHYSRSQDETFESEDSNSTAITPYSPNSNLDGFNSQFMTVDLDLEGFLKPSITGNTTVSTSSSFLFDVSLHSPQSWFEDPSSWTITTFLAIWGFVSIVIGVISLCYYLGLFRNRRKRSKRPKICQEGLPQVIPFSHLEAATNRFHRSKVIYDTNPHFVRYECHLPYHGRCTIKRFMKDKSCRKEWKLWQDGVGHSNIVAVRGCSEVKDEFVLVYDYMPHSLEELLASNGYNIKKFHSWEAKFSIIHSVASALKYLHDIPIVHNNVRSCRIYVDSDLNIKLGDLGHSLPQTNSIDCDSTTTSPPTLKTDSTTTSPPTLKTDVYGFGVVMIEILTGKGHFHKDESLLIARISNLWRIGRLLEAADERLGGDYPTDRMEKMLKVGLWCVQPNPDERPTILAALQMIWGNKPISDPPPPSPLLDVQVESELLDTQIETD